MKDSLRIKSITGEVGEDGIQEGDQLIKIGNKDVSTMPLVRGELLRYICQLGSTHTIMLTYSVVKFLTQLRKE